MKRRVLALICCVAMLASGIQLSALAATIKTNIPKKFPSVKMDPTFTVVNFWHAMSGTNGVTVDNIANWYNSTLGKKNRIYVKAIYQGAYADITIKLQATIQSGQVKNLPDLCQLANDGAFSVANSPAMVYVQDLMNADKSFTIGNKLNKSAMWACSYKGKQLGLPFSNSIMAFYYNIDAFKSVGLDPNSPPKTLAELARIAPKLAIKGTGKKPVRYGLAQKIWGYHISNWIAPQKKGTAWQFDKDEGRLGVPTKLICAEDGTLKATLTEWKKVLDNGANVVDWNTEKPQTNFASGFCASFMVSCAGYDTIATTFQGMKDKSKVFQAGMARVPTVNEDDALGTTTSGSAVYIFNRGNDKQVQAAWDFSKFLASVDVSAYWAEQTGYFPLNNDAINSDLIKNMLNASPAKANIYKARTVNADTNYKFQEPWIPAYTVYSNTIMDQVCLMAQGKQNVDKTVANISSKAASLLKVYWDANK